MREDVRSLVDALMNGISTISGIVSSEHMTTRDHITQQFSEARIAKESKSTYKNIMQSLYFDGMWSRQEQIRDAHESTYEWIFRDPDSHSGRWDNFGTWLRSGIGVYWINGKPGSGKSTLMNFIHSMRWEETRACLTEWAHSRSLLYPSFYLWRSGSPLQRSLNGCLRSILYQMLNSLPDLESDLTFKPASIALDHQRSFPCFERELKASIKAIVNSGKARICIFLDGLDEFEGDPEDLIKFCKELGELENVKVCVSSRPEMAFRNAFMDCKQLRLDELTRNDIRVFVEDSFRGRVDNTVGIKELSSEVMRKANGVFIWVRLVVRSLLEGMENQDTHLEVLERLRETPPELNDLYTQLLRSLRDKYKISAGIFFGLFDALMHVDLPGVYDAAPILLLALGTNQSIEKILSGDANPSLNFSKFEILPLLRQTKVQIESRCKGLLEFSFKGNRRTMNFDENLSLQEMETKLTLWDWSELGEFRWIHRTARDFIMAKSQELGLIRLESPQKMAERRLIAFAQTLAVMMQMTCGKYTSSGLRGPYYHLETLIHYAISFDESSHCSGEMILDFAGASIPREIWGSPKFGRMDWILPDIPLKNIAFSAVSGEFVAVCASYGLNWYIERKVAALPPKEKREGMTFILHYVLQTLEPRSDNLVLQGSARLIARFLNDGAGPNDTVQAPEPASWKESSPWMNFIRVLWASLVVAQLYGESPYFQPDYVEEIFEIAISFLEHGANRFPPVFCSTQIIPRFYAGIHVVFSLSPGLLLHKFLRNHSRYGELMVFLEPETSWSEYQLVEIRGWKDEQQVILDVSEEEKLDFLRAWDRFLEQGLSFVKTGMRDIYSWLPFFDDDLDLGSAPLEEILANLPIASKTVKPLSSSKLYRSNSK